MKTPIKRLGDAIRARLATAGHRLGRLRGIPAHVRNRLGRLRGKLAPARKRLVLLKDVLVYTRLSMLFLFVGFAMVVLEIFVPQYTMFVAIGAGFISGCIVGTYMMLANREVAKNLHERFNEQNEILKDIAATQKDAAATQKDMAATLKRIEQKLDRS